MANPIFGAETVTALLLVVRLADSSPQLQFIPSFLCLAALIGVPESPRWLIYKGRHDEAKAIIIKYHGCGDPESPVAALEYTEICDTLAFETSVQKTNAKTLVSTKGNRWRLGVAMSMGVFSQLSGNNIITYYLSDVLDAAGITGVQTQLGLNIGISLLNLFAAAIGSLFMNKFRRRPSFRKSKSYSLSTSVLLG